MAHDRLDCLLVGYHESPFSVYEEKIRVYGEDSEAYRDLKFSMLDFGGRKRSYVDTMNHLYSRAHGLPETDYLRSGAIPNLAAVYLANYLRRQGFRADIVNHFQAEHDLLRDPPGGSPLAIGITTTLLVLNFPVIEIVASIREHHPQTKIVVGGPLIANHARNYQGDELRSALADTGADIFVIEGQGESTLAAILAALKNGGDLSAVPNIAYFDDGEFHLNPPIAEANSLDENYVDWSHFAAGRDLGATIQTRTARSCAFKCAFCNYPTRAGKLSLAKVDTIEKELDSMARLGNVRNVVFIDDTFNVPLPRFKDICRLLIEKKYGFEWYSYFRCSNSDEEAFDLMAESGCGGVFLGIESGSPTILENMDKHATIEKYAVGIEELRKRDIVTFGSFILGFPGECESTVRETIDFIRQTKPDYFRAQLWYNEEGTPIQKRRDEFAISGQGFGWEHADMDSLEAMDWIERLFLEVKESIWLPQWSFDFWIIPYLRGLGMSSDQFRSFTAAAHEMLRLEIASVPPDEKARLQEPILQRLLAEAQSWRLSGLAD